MIVAEDELTLQGVKLNYLTTKEPFAQTLQTQFASFLRMNREGLIAPFSPLSSPWYLLTVGRATYLI